MHKHDDDENGAEEVQIDAGKLDLPAGVGEERVWNQHGGKNASQIEPCT
jgi:hypothetical protein